MKKYFGSFVCIIVIILLLTISPSALAYDFSVGPFGETTKTVNLYQGDTVTGNITASVSSGSLLPVMGSLIITGPDKNLVMSQSVVSSKLIPFYFKADKSGDYQITFSSLNAWSYTHVILEYTVPNHTILGLNNVYGPVIVAVGFSVFCLAIGGIFLVRHNRRNSLKAKTLVNPSSTVESLTVAPTTVTVSDNNSLVSQIKCERCSTLNDIDAEFCKKCGNKLR